RAAGTRPHSPAPGIPSRPFHHRIERPHAPPAVARAIAARRQAILHHHLDQPPLPTIPDEEMDWHFNSGAYRRDHTLPMDDGHYAQLKARKCFEHLHKKFSRAKREWIGSLHVQGFYLCTWRFDAPVRTANTPCAACVKRLRGPDLVKVWNNRFASVLTWLESTTSEKQEAHPQWEGILGAIGHQMDVDLGSAGED
ncbi:hypothetical protein N0V85_005245, partial [Neurospora sp. IMI 360204]